MKTVLVILFCGLTAFADPPPKRAADSTYFNISFQAQEAVARADRQAAAGQWPAAARAFQEIGEKFADSLIADGPHRFVNIRDFVNRTIAAWPPEGLAAYRAAFEPAAKKSLDELEAGPSIDSRVRLADRFYATASGATALDRAAQRAMEAAEFDAARRWYEQLLADHPDRVERSSEWKAKLALCQALQGDKAALERAITDLAHTPKPAASPDSESLSRLRAALEECRNDGTPTPTPAQPSLLGGAPDRRGLFPSSASAEARWWRFTAFGRLMTDEIAEGYESRLAKLEAYHRALANGRLLACQPVASIAPQSLNPSAPLIFIHDARSVWAIDPQRTDRPVWQFDLSQVLPAPAAWNSEESAPPLYTSLFVDGRLYVHLEREVTDNVSEHVTVASSLVCLDASDGRLLWRNDLEGFVSHFEEARIDGAPLLHRGALYAVARRRKPFGFEACYLLRLDPDDGRLLASVHLGEAATGSYGFSRATLTIPAAQGELVFVPTNLGGIAAVSTSSNRVAWTYQYDSRFGANPDTAWPEAASRPLRSWHYNSAILWKDALVCMPLDAENILVLSRDDGHEIFNIPAESLHRPQTLLGLSGDRLYTAGAQVVCYDLAERKIAWQRPVDRGQLFGRGALTTGGIFLPTDRGLMRYPLDGGTAQFFHWSIEEAGNLLALPDQIVVSAPGALFGLVAKEDAFVRLDRQMKDRPGDPLIALSLAELAFNTGEYQRGLDATHAAIDRVGGFARLTDASLRRRFFTTLTQFARTLLEQPDGADAESSRVQEKALEAASTPQSRPHAAVEVLKLAAACAPEPADQAAQRLMLARAYLDANDPANAVLCYQQILTDRGLRRLKLELRPVMKPVALPADDDNSADESPAEIAPTIASWIARLITRHGGEIYAPIARQAANRLTIASASGSADALLEVADAYPNSPAAQQALIAHAAQMTKQRDWSAATRSYRRALRNAEPASCPDLIRQYADCFLAAGRPSEAAAWLARGARDYPDFRFTLDASAPRPLSFSAFSQQRFGGRTFCEPAHDIRIGRIADTYRGLNPDRVAVLEPLFPNLPDTRWDALVTFSGHQLEAQHPIDGRKLWSKPFASGSQPVFVGMSADFYIFATPYRLFALTRTSGQLAWHVGDDPPEDANADPESLPAFAHYCMTPTRLFVSTDRGILACIDVKTGRTIWENKTGSPPSGQLVADENYCCFGAWQIGDHVIMILDAGTGRLIRHLKTDEKGPAQSLFLTTDFGPPSLLVVRAAIIERFELTSGQSVWKITAPEHFLAATLQIDSEGLIVSADGRRLTRYDLDSGRLLWRSRPLADAAGALWCQLSRGVLYAATDHDLFALDADDGRTLWTAPCPAALAAQPPRLLLDRIVTIAPEGEPAKTRARAGGPEQTDDETVQYRLRAFELDSGKTSPLHSKRHESQIEPGKIDANAGTLLTEPVSSFGGLFARDQALILLDGSRFIGYVAKNGN